MDYKTLNALPADAFLSPANFVTAWDTINTHRAKEQHEKGIEIGRKAKNIFIAADGTWGASMKDGSSITSYEGIGYHAHTSSLLEGFLASGAKITVYRQNGESKVIRPEITN